MLARMVLQSFLRNIRSSIWILASLASCAALVALFTTMALEVGERMTSALRKLGANAVVYPASQPEPDNPADMAAGPDWHSMEEMARSHGAEVVRLRLRVGLVRARPVAVVAAPPKGLQKMTPYWSITGRRTRAPGECTAGSRLAAALSLKVGSRVDVEWAHGGKKAMFKVVGILDSGDEDEDRLFVDSHLPLASGAGPGGASPPGHPGIPGLGPGERVDCLACHQDGVPSPGTAPPTAPGGPVPRAAPLPGKLPPAFQYALLSVPGGEESIVRIRDALSAEGIGVVVKPLRQILHGEASVLEKVNLLSGVALLTVVILTLMGVSAAMLARVAERRKELALLQALGARRRSVVWFLLAESAAIGTAASLLGFGAGTLLAMTVAEEVFGVSMSPQWTALLASFMVATLVSVLSSSFGCCRALRIPPATALRGE